MIFVVTADDLSPSSYRDGGENSLCRTLSFPEFPIMVSFLNHAERESFIEVRDQHCKDIWRRQRLLQNEEEIFRR